MTQKIARGEDFAVTALGKITALVRVPNRLQQNPPPALYSIGATPASRRRVFGAPGHRPTPLCYDSSSSVAQIPDIRGQCMLHYLKTS